MPLIQFSPILEIVFGMMLGVYGIAIVRGTPEQRAYLVVLGLFFNGIRVDHGGSFNRRESPESSGL